MILQRAEIAQVRVLGGRIGQGRGLAGPEGGRVEQDREDRHPGAGSGPPPSWMSGWLFSSLVILQDGTVTMCGADWDAHAPLGNVRTASLADIWDGAELARRRRAHLDGDYGAVAVCGGCDDWRLADGEGYTNVLR